MRSRRYLNAILTINAVLLTAVLWTAVAGWPLLATEASAQVRSTPLERFQPPNAATQRAELAKEMRAVRASVDSLASLVKSGEIKVKVTNASELRAAASN